MSVVIAEGSLRSRLREVGIAWSGSQVELIALAVALDDSGEWIADGARTCAQWIADALDIETCTARDWLRIGRSLRELPQISAAFTNGELSFSKIRALTRVATHENETDLVAVAERTPASRLAYALAAYLNATMPGGELDDRQNAARRPTTTPRTRWDDDHHNLFTASTRSQIQSSRR